MSRQDANRIALRAVSAILDASQPLDLRIDEHQIVVKPERLAPPTWPEQRLDGITENNDGPWPAPVTLACEWPEGRCQLMLSASHWGRKVRKVSLAIEAPETNRKLVWITVADHIRDAHDGEEAQVYASPSLVDRSGKYARIREALNQEIRRLVNNVGLPMLSPGRVDAFRMRIPGGEVSPAPSEVYANLVRLALIKLPFRDVGVQRAIHGISYIDIDTLISRARAGLSSHVVQTSSGKHIITRRMPGGYRGYKASLDRVLYFLVDSPTRVEALDRFIEDELEISRAATRRRMVSGLEDMGLIREDEDMFELTERAREYLADSSDVHLFRLLHETYEGLLATLVVAGRSQGADSNETTSLLAALCDLPDLSQQQMERRRNWLTSLGLTKRIGGADRITDTGRAVLDQYADEADELAARLEQVESTPEGESEPEDAVLDDSQDIDDDESVPPEDREQEEPPNWDEQRLDLQEQSVEPHIGRLELPDGLIERLCAVLSAGKHLLLVGPPGTGKTDLAHAIAHAARDQGYCSGLYSATASADWTTYETIGGYALGRDGELHFRPGAFLRAVELWQWLLIDELNRADVDKAFGELMSVLSGKHTDTHYERDDGRHISIGNDSKKYTHWVPNTFRVLATMNTWDKTSLFRLSYALQRRFAVVHVGVPAPEKYAALIAHAATVAAADPRLDDQAIARLQDLFSTGGLLTHRAIGPAMALDMVRYMRRRQNAGDAMAEAVAMFLLPQLEGLDRNAAKGAAGAIVASLRGWTTKAALRELDERYCELFPSSGGLGK